MKVFILTNIPLSTRPLALMWIKFLHKRMKKPEKMSKISINKRNQHLNVDKWITFQQ